jgi:uncharacterized membrane protein YphA (DoxX/SURF4 family)
MNTETLQSAGLLVLRLVVGTTFLALTIDMLVALFTTHVGHGFFVEDGGFELVLLLAGASLALALGGPGRYSVDAVSGLGRHLDVTAAVRLTRRIST